MFFPDLLLVITYIYKGWRAYYYYYFYISFYEVYRKYFQIIMCPKVSQLLLLLFCSLFVLISMEALGLTWYNVFFISLWGGQYTIWLLLLIIKMKQNPSDSVVFFYNFFLKNSFFCSPIFISLFPLYFKEQGL